MKLPVGDLEASVVPSGGGFRREGLAAGGRDNGAPGPRLQYSPGQQRGSLSKCKMS